MIVSVNQHWQDRFVTFNIVPDIVIDICWPDKHVTVSFDNAEDCTC